MYRCCDCGKLFREPKVEWEQVGWYGMEPYREPFAYCPNCGSDDYDEVDEDAEDFDDLEEVFETKDQMWAKLLELGVCEQTLQVVTDINGYSEETMLDILYSVTGYRNFEQMED